jgi:asparagine synthetase B (glutamine-hydrolysing)
MCGIHASVSTEGFLTPSLESKKLLLSRGPDCTGETEARFDSHEWPYYLSFTSTVLALRGGHVTPQPFVDTKSGSVLCWNGEAWRIGSDPIAGNDGQSIFDTLLEAVAEEESVSNSTIAVLKVLNSISGPFAFVFLDQKHKQIFFGRDRLGRRSLLSSTGSNYIEFSSIADPSRGIWKEVEADAVYLLSPSHGVSTDGAQIPDDILGLPSSLLLIKYSWEVDSKNTVCSIPPSSSHHADILRMQMASLGYFNRSIPSGYQSLNSQSESISMLRHFICESLKLRILNIPVPPDPGNSQNIRVAVLFSGGLDCTVLARMAHDLLPPEYQIDLLNVAFENPRVIQAAMAHGELKSSASARVGITTMEGDQIISGNSGKLADKSAYETCPDRETGRKAFQELNTVCPTRVWRFVAVRPPSPFYL